jgi:hypothetical protein
VSCTTCHTTAGSYMVYNCIGCHTKSTTDAQHRGRNGYTWASTACYACHPNGRS